ncbi:hypothetical protein PMKS-002979 [Pichia membranifaciens]|uniref:G-patch domain-containing protein n=1 Tax=Pichia membranifaciens TaxID=4926 RepID=A0A1Q2YIV2_9ASCO|nr:hypothetical protein PMKS-002979 [Pichia membranifaciens]
MGNGKGRKHSGRGSGRSRGAVRGRGRGKVGGRGGSRRGGGRNGSSLPKFVDEFDPQPYIGNEGNAFGAAELSRVKLNKRLKVSKLKQINDMVDLNRGNFTNIEELSVNSMMYHQTNTRRKRYNDKSMYSEVGYTNSHREDVLRKSYRKLTVEFVRAKEVYDPSKSLLEKLSKADHNPTIVDIEEKIVRENSELQNEEENLETNGHRPHMNDEILSAEELSEPDEESDNNSDTLSDNFDHSDEPDELSEVSPEAQADVLSSGVSKANSGKAQHVYTTSNPNLKVEKLDKHRKRSSVIFFDDNDEAEYNVSYDEKDDSDEESTENEISEKSFDQSIYNSEHDDFIEDNLDIHEDECDALNSSVGEIQIGRYLGSMKTSNQGENYIELPRFKRNKQKSEKVLYMFSDDDDDFDIDDVVKHVNHKLSGTNKKENLKEEVNTTDPEFGFLEEDYVSFDVTSIIIDNLRAGANQSSRQYYVQAPFLFGFEDFQWLNRDDLLNLLVENGFPEHRFDAFIKKATSHLLHPEIRQREEMFDEDEIYISDSSEEEDCSDLKPSRTPQTDLNSTSDEGELDEELMEGIEDLLTMHKCSKMSHFDPLDVGTKSIKVKGRKKTSGLELNTEISPEFEKFLNDKYVLRKQNKKEKKEEREFARKNNAYMLTKYPYVLEMTEIIDEFKDFREDHLRESLRFPPLDFHVNMVLKMIAEAFGYSSRKIGKGKKEYLEVRKPRKSKTKEPDLERIRKLSLKRNLCFRMDVKLSTEEKRELKRVKGGNVEVEKLRNKGRGNFSYKEGEVVGANAKEIDSSSIGRKLLEKMGWQAGDALGPHNNKGIVEPIKVVVKTSKRGL